MLTYTGVVVFKGEETQVTEKFKKREFVLTDNHPSYPQKIIFQVTQNWCDIIDNIEAGEEVTVHFNLKGREWKNPKGEIKYFNTLDAFRITSKSGFKSSERLDPVTSPDDDLPF